MQGALIIEGDGLRPGGSVRHGRDMIAQGVKSYARVMTYLKAYSAQKDAPVNAYQAGEKE